MSVLVIVVKSHDREVAAHPLPAPILLVRNDVAVVAVMLPVVALARWTVERHAIRAPRVGPIITIDVAGDGVSGEAAKNHTAYNGAPVSVADCSPYDAARDRPQNGTRRPIVAMTIVAVIIVRASRRHARAAHHQRCNSDL